ncbi:MAG: VWA domain-containing protein [Ruminococcaceae bacterium]|nr:VWA domain-containing protein [Oscillospiraceae bacterium]
MKKLLSILLTLSLLITLASCGAAKDSMGNAPMENEALLPNYNAGALPEDGLPDQEENKDPSAPTFKENPFIATMEQPVSTFSADVDTASYTYFRKLVNNNYAISYLRQNGASFRTEEFINYFKYEAVSPQNGELFGVKAEIAQTPWNANTRLLRLTLQAEESTPEGGNNLVFLIDVSGSMSSSDKLPLLKKAFTYLTSQLTEQDRVSIVTYSGKEEVVLSGCPGNQGERILQAINSLKASGSTNGQAGLQRAYQVAADSMIENGNNRIIMASDGDLNVGISSAEELKQFVEAKRDQGIYLSVLGFGTGNYRDANMEALADNGNGVYYYIDGESEAERIFGTDLLSTLYTVAKDTKLQITFDPAAVSSYRLIGYENRMLNQEDFEDDTKDAGEVGAGHQVTVCYELTLTEQTATLTDWMKLAVRYKRPNEETSTLNEYAIGSANLTETPTADFRFITAVIEIAMYLHNSAYLDADFTLEVIAAELNAMDFTSLPDRAELRALITKLCGQAG